jgi:hypothetical protein
VILNPSRRIGEPRGYRAIYRRMKTRAAQSLARREDGAALTSQCEVPAPNKANSDCYGGETGVFRHWLAERCVCS